MLMYPLFIGTWEVILLVFVILLLFGGRKIPELMRGLGQGVKSFKKGMQDIENEVNAPVKTSEKINEAKEVEYDKDEKA